MIASLKQSLQSLATSLRRLPPSPALAFLGAAAPGIVGVALLTGFAATVLTIQGLEMFLPAAVGFNSAFCGYGLADRHQGFPFRKTALLAMAVLFTLVGSTVFTLIYPWSPLLDWKRLLICAAAAAVLSHGGAWLADKNKKLQTTPHSPPDHKEERQRL